MWLISGFERYRLVSSGTLNREQVHVLKPRFVGAKLKIRYGIEVRAMSHHHLWNLWRHDEGQDIAEYAVMLAVILVLVVGTIRLIGSNANNAFSNVASSLQ